ncbi:hypothetical protein ACQ9ZF_12395 (plasmid) [Cetobacterium somerae]|uniref:hypothetical protein n=1 Tax=Cetobacterium somerae TaxID=188913 RepID=UPI003D7675D9
MSEIFKKYKKKGNQTNEKKILIENYGMCPLCLEKLLDNHDGYIGKNLIVGDIFTIICQNCYQKIMIEKLDLDEIVKFIKKIKKDLDNDF